jgi:hypothetical protein
MKKGVIAQTAETMGLRTVYELYSDLAYDSQGNLVITRTHDAHDPSADMVVKILNGQKPGVDFPFRAAPHIPLITPRNINHYAYENLFGERGFVAVSDHFE